PPTRHNLLDVASGDDAARRRGRAAGPEKPASRLHPMVEELVYDPLSGSATAGGVVVGPDRRPRPRPLAPEVAQVPRAGTRRPPPPSLGWSPSADPPPPSPVLSHSPPRVFYWDISGERYLPPLVG